MIMKASAIRIFVSVVLAIFLNTNLPAQNNSSSEPLAQRMAENPRDMRRILAEAGKDWCGTDRQFRARNQMRDNEAGCAVMGPPDVPENRDACVPGPTTPIK